MDDTVIRVENLSKIYQIGQRELYRTLRESLIEIFAAPFRRMRSFFRESQTNPPYENNHVWALQDVSFEVKAGEVVGIIGKNGAGKSTLLRVLSRITEPTEGYAEIRGRVGSLLEVGTGFHYELTGRENIYLSGAILGMKKAEIARKFDDIVAFAEVEKFIDTPVKHYSSGMFVRLAFAVAAHLEPDILLVDEVLAMGDAAFQKKCLGRMGRIGGEGRTILFVSHQMLAIQQLCQRVIILDKGKIKYDGNVSKAVQIYMSMSSNTTSSVSWDNGQQPENTNAYLTRCEIINYQGNSSTEFLLSEPIFVKIRVNINQDGIVVCPSIVVHDLAGAPVFASGAFDKKWILSGVSSGIHDYQVTIPGNLLNSGNFSLSFFLTLNSSQLIARVPQAIGFSIVDDGTGRGEYSGPMIGVVRPILEWRELHE
jgi:lipopolysaccharide transport system ATP-binding protein